MKDLSRRMLMFCLLLFISLGNVLAERYYTRQLSSFNGLSQNDVMGICQDSKGFVWMATNGGLNRYDGYEFKFYGIGDKGLNTNLFLSLTNDKNGNLWIGTAGDGVYMYDIVHDEFHPILLLLPDGRHSDNMSIAFIAIDEESRIWCYDTKTRSVYSFFYDAESCSATAVVSQFAPVVNGVNCLVTAVDGSVYLGTYSGLFKCAVSNKGRLVFVQLTETVVNEVCPVNGRTLVCSNDKSLYSVDIPTKTITPLLEQEGVQFIKYRSSTLYFANSDGIYSASYNPLSNLLSDVEIIKSQPQSLPKCMMLDRDDAVWVGYLKLGAFYGHKDSKQIEYCNNFGNNHLTMLGQMLENKIFVGTEGSGLYVYDYVTKDVKLIDGSEGGIVYAATLSDNKDYLYWALFDNGLYQYDLKTGYNEKIFEDRNIRYVLQDGNFLWIATYAHGLYRYNLQTRQAVGVSYSDGSSLRIVRNLLKDKEGNIWVATDLGLRVVRNFNTNSEVPIVSMVDNADLSDYIISMFLDNDGTFWYGTLGRGLKHVTHVSAGCQIETTTYNKSNGLSSNTIKSIFRDDMNDIWVSTNRGINRIEVSTGKVMKMDIANGLQDFEFNEISGCKLTDGTLCFGGVNGLNIFNPASFKTDRIQSAPLLTDFEIFNISIELDSVYGMKNFSGNIACMNHIELPYTQNSFTFEFSSMNYFKSDALLYQYRLEGIDNKWVETDSHNRRAVYSHVAPGRYVFHLRSSNSDGIWNSPELVIPVVINPPFWRTWYAYLFYCILVSLFIWYLKRIYTERMHRRNELYIANFEKRKSEEILDMKVQFFTNISHELRTPLTLINSPLQMIMSDEKYEQDSKLMPLLRVMEHNVDVLTKNVNEILNFAKNENGKLKLHLQYADIMAYARKVYAQFEYWGRQKGIVLSYCIPENGVSLFFDPILMEQVFYNLMSNAIKHTPAGGMVVLSLSRKDNNVIVSVSDSGNGISDEIKDHIFDRFYSEKSAADSASPGTGIGLYLTKTLIEMHEGSISFDSEKGKGTIFTFTLPIVEHPEISKSEQSTSNVSAIQSVTQTATDVSDADISRESYKDEMHFNIKDKSTLPLILVVDDNQEMRNLLKQILSDSYRVKLANDGESAWSVIPELQPDLVLSDIMMPGIDGLKLCELIKTEVKTSHIPVILLSAKSSPLDVVAGYHYQADAYCSKPFENQVLLAMIQSLVDNRKLILSSKSSLDIQLSETVTTSTDEHFIKRLVEIVESNMSNSDFQVEDLCNGVGVTAIVLNKKLKTLIGMTANVFIRSVRMKRAASLLKTGTYSVAEVTYDVGFNDLKYFRDCFKKEFGMLPQQYKEMFCNDTEKE